MKTYKKVGGKIVSTESVELEVDVASLESRVETLNKAIESIAEQVGKSANQINTYELEKAELEADLKKIKKL